MSRCKACDGPMGSTVYVRKRVGDKTIPEELCIHCLRAIRGNNEDVELNEILNDFNNKARHHKDEWD